MKIHILHNQPAPSLASALSAFEAEFIYPLGPGRTFRISHGEDYTRFFRAMGDARIFVAEAAGRVVGTVGISLRDLTLDDGNIKRAAYIGDVKIARSARGGVVLHRLARAADAWARPQVQCAFGVVMDGTASLPDAYTGRAGVPAFTKLGALSVLRLPTDSTSPDECVTLAPNDGAKLYKALSVGRAFAVGGDSAERSDHPPQWIVSPDHQACGRIEDTRRAKRLLSDDGAELLSAHLACFAWRTDAAAKVVIAAARRRAAECGFPSLFFAVDSADAVMFNATATGGFVTIAGATVFGVNLRADAHWSISSSEI